MCGGLNFLNKVSVPWDLTCDEIIYCMEGTFRLTCDGESYDLQSGRCSVRPAKTITSPTNATRSA